MGGKLSSFQTILLTTAHLTVRLPFFIYSGRVPLLSVGEAWDQLPARGQHGILYPFCSPRGRKEVAALPEMVKS